MTNPTYKPQSNIRNFFEGIGIVLAMFLAPVGVLLGFVFDLWPIIAACLILWWMSH